MKAMKLISLFLVIVVLASCKKSEDTPYIIFKDASGDLMNEGVYHLVPLSSTFRIHAEVGYKDFEGNNLDYSWKIDQGDFVQYSAFDGLNITTLGISNNLRTEQAILDVTFSPTIVSSGSFVTIRINDQGTLTRQLIFEVE